MSFYKVCMNTFDGGSGKGLAYCKSPTLAERDENSIAPWNSSVWGVKEGDFVRVGQQYLPIHLNGELVLIEEGERQEGAVGEQPLPENLSCKPAPMQDDKSQELKHNDRELVMVLSRLHRDFANMRSESGNTKEVLTKQLALQQEQFNESINGVVETMNEFEARLTKLGGLVRLCRDFEARLLGLEVKVATSDDSRTSVQDLEARLATNEKRLEDFAGIENVVQTVEARLAVQESRADKLPDAKPPGLAACVTEIRDTKEQIVRMVKDLARKTGQMSLCADESPKNTLTREVNTKSAQLPKSYEACDAELKGKENHVDEESRSEAHLAQKQGLAERVMPELPNFEAASFKVLTNLEAAMEEMSAGYLKTLQEMSTACLKTCAAELKDLGSQTHDQSEKSVGSAETATLRGSHRSLGSSRCTVASPRSPSRSYRGSPSLSYRPLTSRATSVSSISVTAAASSLGDGSDTLECARPLSHRPTSKERNEVDTQGSISSAARRLVSCASVPVPNPSGILTSRGIPRNHFVNRATTATVGSGNKYKVLGA